jgi:hypothetical protein
MVKYKLTDETKELDGHILYRIEALVDINNVKKGYKGGWIEKESNLSQEGICWVYDNALVHDNAVVCDNAWVRDNAKLCDNAVVCGNAKVLDNAVVRGNAVVCGDALVCDNAIVCGDAWVSGNAIIEKMGDYIVFQNWWSSGRFFTYTKSNKMWKVGCFYGTSEELIKKAYTDSEEKGKCYKIIVKSVNSIENVLTKQ